MESTCKNYFTDHNINDHDSKYFMFASDDGQRVQIRRFNSDKLLARDMKQYLTNYDCGGQSLTSDKDICKRLVDENNIDDLWTLTQYNNSGELT